MVMVGSTYGFPGAGWCITSVFFVLMVRLRLSQAIENLSTLFCMLALVVVFSAQSLVNRNLLTISVFSLVFAWNLLSAVSVVSNVDSIIWATKCIKQHCRKQDTEKSGSQDTPLLNPTCDGKIYGALSVVLHSCMHTIIKLSKDGDEFFGAAIFCHDLNKGHHWIVDG